MNKSENLKGTENKSLSRRNFLGTVGAATAAFTIIPNHVMAGRGYQQPSDMVNVAGVGVGARGASNIQGFCDPEVQIVRQYNRDGTPLTKEQIAQSLARQQERVAGQTREPRKIANIYALCDVDANYASHVFAAYAKAKVYSDWRQMLEKEKSSIDAVMIGTPDHNHAPIAAAFMKEKKHVYVEKPMCKTIYEARQLAALAKEHNVVTQVGNQGHASEGTRMTVEWIQSGVIGHVKKVTLSTNRPSWPQGDLERPTGVRVPRNLNWDVWLGPAPEKPYHPSICHFNWRGLWDYGTGAMGDMGAHIFDAPIWALNLGLPTKIQATSTPYSDEFLPQGEWVTYEFAERFTPNIGYMPPVTVSWCDGGLRPPRPSGLEAGTRVADAVYYGEKGVMMHGSHGAVPRLVPDVEDFQGPKPWIPRTGDIYEDFIDAIQNGKKSSNDFSWASKVTEIMLLTNIAVLTQRSSTTLEYDAENMRITNLDEANELFHYKYRDGWSM